jgi:hypothetical protein
MDSPFISNLQIVPSFTGDIIGLRDQKQKKKRHEKEMRKRRASVEGTWLQWDSSAEGGLVYILLQDMQNCEKYRDKRRGEIRNKPRWEKGQGKGSNVNKWCMH